MGLRNTARDQFTLRESPGVRSTVIGACLVLLTGCNRATQNSTGSSSPVTADTSVRTADATPTGSDADADTLLVNVQSLDSTIRVDMRYRNKDNFTGARLAGYEANHAFMRREAATALVQVQASLKKEGLGLKIWDAYRPIRATLAMVEWTKKVHREDLVRDGYISDRSKHNLGAAIDLTLVQLVSGKELDLGTPHDSFAAEAHTANATGVIAANRAKLVGVMQAAGFVNYDMEWWHFSFALTNPMRFDRVIK